ncbi:TrbG/VirB9 family P-type conjugative transfer protein [Brevundimonas sp.]|uniref:TrbG/VirB9 family P-type conjugative transfer protein n=1 Tax=Brevundimonas sp. TaxID=1871086 RepID=UPI003B00C8ED
MIRSLLVAAATVAVLASPAAARPRSEDPRIREVAYAEGEVYRISGAYRIATQIVFAPDEVIRHAAIGDSVAWEVAAEGSVLFLKPRERHGGTNLLVVTERAGAIRHYAFELTARDATDRSPLIYQLRFLYPADAAAEAARRLQVETRNAEQRLVALELQRGALEGPRNLAWSAQGDATLQPSEVSDNGRFTVLRFPGGQAIPALFEVGEDGSERLIPYDVRGEFVVVHAAPRGLRLRRGRAVLCLFNDAFDPRGSGSHTGTASPAVERLPTGDQG